ncbi:hypothetical protein MMC11_007655 [Xylographa trunciseda]|nr:hypothetical protein [Xylographa trunciseda]
MAATIPGAPDRNLDLLVEQLRQGKAIFSTNLGKYPARRAQPNSTPVILRSDCEADLASMIAELRVKFPQECRKITLPVNNIYEYFDHYDVNIQGSTFIVRLLVEIATENEKQKQLAREFATKWMGSHIEGFPDIDLDDEDLFSIEEKERYNPNFLQDILQMLKGFQASSEQTTKRGRLTAPPSTRYGRPSSIRQESPASSSFESNPSNYRRAASASRERSSFLAPPLALGPSLLTNRAYTRRRNSARHVSAEQRPSFVLPVQYHSDTDAEAGVGLRNRLPLPSELQLQNLHMHYNVRSMSENTTGVADPRHFFANRSNYAPGVVEPFPPYFQTHNLGNTNAGSSRILNRYSRGQPIGQQGGPRQPTQTHDQANWSYHAVNQYTSSPTLRVLSESNLGSSGHNHRNFSGGHRTHAVYSSDPAFPLSSSASSVRPSPVLGGQAVPYIPNAVPQTAPGFSAEGQPYTYHGYIENMPPSSSQGFRGSALSSLPMPRVRNSHQSQVYQPSQNVPNQFSQQNHPSARHEYHHHRGELHGRAQSQAHPRSNPRKSFSDDARTMQPGDINSRRSSGSENHPSRRGSSSELHGYTRDQGNVQQARRTSGARNGSRHSSFSQSHLPFREQYKRSVQGAYGGYSPMGYFSAGQGSGDYSHLIHQTIEEHRSDGDRHSLANHNEVAGNENDKRQMGRYGEAISNTRSASYSQEQGFIPAEQVRRVEMTSGDNGSIHPSPIQTHQLPQLSNTASNTQPLPSALTVRIPQDNRSRYDRSQMSDQPIDPLKLFVTASTESTEEIQHMFRPYGKIREIIGPFTKSSTKYYPNKAPAPFYFLTYSQPAEAIAAIEHLNRTPMHSGAGYMKVAFAFLRPNDIREAQEVTSSAKSATRFTHPRNTQLLNATNSQATPPARKKTQSASQGSSDQLPVPNHMPADMANTLNRQNVRSFSNVSNPSTPKKKKNGKKHRNQTSTRKEGDSSVDPQSRVAKPVSQTPHTPGSRTEVKELDNGAVGAHERVAIPDQVVSSSHLIAEASDKENNNSQGGDRTERASKARGASAENSNISVSHKYNFPRRKENHVDREQLNILDGSPSRKPRNPSSSRKTSQPESQSAQTDAHEQFNPGSAVVAELQEDQWPALQRPSPSPKEGQHGLIVTKRLNYRAISSKAALEGKSEGLSKSATTQKEVSVLGEGPSNASSNVKVPVTIRVNSSNRSDDLRETPRIISADQHSGDVKCRKVTLPRDIITEVPSTSTSVEASREVSSAGGDTTADPASYSQTERSNSWAEDVGKYDTGSPGKLNNRENTTTNQVPIMVSGIDQTRHISNTFGTQKPTDGSLISQLPEKEDRALSSHVSSKLEMTPPSDGTSHDATLIPIPTVNVGPPLTKHMSSISTTVASSFVVPGTHINLSSRKGKHKALTIDVPLGNHQSTSAHIAVPPPSNSPKSSKSKQRLEEEFMSSSISVPSLPISTHMKKKTRKITPPRKTSKTSEPNKKDTKVHQSPTKDSKCATLDGSPNDVGLPVPVLEQEIVADTQVSSNSNSETAEATELEHAMDQELGQREPDNTQPDEHSITETAESNDQISRTRSYPAPDPSNAVYVSEILGPSAPLRRPSNLGQPRPESQLVQGRSYPPPDPSSAVYVTGRFPTRMLLLEGSDQVKDETVTAKPLLSPDIPSKKERIRTKKAKKRKSKEISEHQNTSELQSIVPFPKPKAPSAAFPTLPLDEPSPTESLSQEHSEVGAETSDPFAVLDPMLQTEHVGRRERHNTGVWIDTVNEKRHETKAMMARKNVGKSSDVETVDKKGQEYRKRKAPLKTELLQHVDIVKDNGSELIVDTTSKDPDSSSMDSMKQDMACKLLSTKSSINDLGSVPDLTRGSSIVSSSSNVIFPDVLGFIPRSMSTILTPVNLTHDPSFNSDSLETSNLKARPPPHLPKFDSNFFDRPAIRIESPPKSPLAVEFGSGSISTAFKPDIEQEEIGSEAFAPITSPVKPIFSLGSLDISSTVLEAPLKKMKLSEGAGSFSVASGFEHKSLNEHEASGKHLEVTKLEDTISNVRPSLSAEPGSKSQLSDDTESEAEVKPLRQVEAFEEVEKPREVPLTDHVKPSAIVGTYNAVSDPGDMSSIEANINFQRLEDSKSIEEVSTDVVVKPSEDSRSVENVNLENEAKPEKEEEQEDDVKPEDEASSQIGKSANTAFEAGYTAPLESGPSVEPSNVPEQLGTSVEVEELPSNEQNSPTKTAEDAEPFSAVSEASTVKAIFPSLPSESFSTIPDSPPKLSEANVAAHTVATDSDDAREQRRSRNESISEWSTTSSFRRKTYSEAANIPSSTHRTRGQSMVGVTMSPAESEAEMDVKRKIKPRRGEANLWSLPPKEQRWTSAEE